MGRLVTAVALAVFCAAAYAQEPTLQQKLDDLKKELAKLQDRVKQLETEKGTSDAENARLKKEVDQLQQFSVEAAQKLSVLRNLLEAKASTPPPVKPDEGTGQKPPPVDVPPKRVDVPVGPTAPLKAKVLVVVPDYGFLIIDKGEPDGIKEGWTFDILRRVPDKVNGDRYEQLGQAVFQKFVESAQKTQSKLNITKGLPEKMKYDDLAVAVRVIDPAIDPKGNGETPPVKTEEKKYKITGITKDTIMIDYGQRDGAHMTDRVFVLRDGRVVAQLRLDSVEKDWSAGKIIDNTKTAEPAINDVIQLKESKTTIMGKVKRNDDKTGVWLDNVGTVQGARVGMIFEVRRQGRVVGKIVLKDVKKFWSTADPMGETRREDIQEDDFVESVD